MHPVLICEDFSFQMSYSGNFAVHVDFLIKDVLVKRLMNPYLTKIMRGFRKFYHRGSNFDNVFFYYLFS